MSRVEDLIEAGIATTPQEARAAREERARRAAHVSAAWVRRYDRVAAEYLGEPVLAAAPFLRPRGWRAFGHAVAGTPILLAQRATGRRPSATRLPEACLVAVTAGHVRLLAVRGEPGDGPVHRVTGRIAAWPRAAVAVRARHELMGIRLSLVPRGGPGVELHGPPDDLSVRVVRALSA